MRRLRLALVSSKYPPTLGGSERACRALATALSERGHDVHVLTRAVAEAPSGMTLEAGVAVHRVLRPLALGPLWGLTYMRQVRHALRTLGPFDVIHCRQTYLHTIVAAAEARRTGAGCVSTIASSGALHDLARLRAHRFGDRWVRAAIAPPVMIHALSRRSAEEAASWIRDPDRIAVVPNFVEPGAFPTRSPERPPMAIFVGRLVPVKDVPTLLEAFAQCPPPAQLRIVGDGPMLAELEARAAHLGIGDRAVFLGRREDVTALLAESGLAVSASSTEGLSNAMLEALAAGLGVLAYDVGGARDALDPDGTGGISLAPGLVRLPAGLLAEPANRQALAKGMGLLFADAALRAELGVAARAVAERHFSRDAVLARYEELYARAMALSDEVRSR